MLVSIFPLASQGIIAWPLRPIVRSLCLYGQLRRGCNIIFQDNLQVDFALAHSIQGAGGAFHFALEEDWMGSA